MNHDYCRLTNVCLRCLLTRAEANAFDPPATCGQVPVNPDIAEARKKKLVADGLYRDADEPPTPAPAENPPCSVVFWPPFAG